MNRSDEVEPSLFKVFAHGIGFRRARRNLVDRAPLIHLRLPSHELPDVAVERAEFFLHTQEGFCILYRGGDLKPVAHDAGIAQETLRLAAGVTSNSFGIEPIEGGAVVFPFLQDCVPAQACLGALQEQELKQDAIIVLRLSPLFIVVTNRKRIARPTAAHKL